MSVPSCRSPERLRVPYNDNLNGAAYFRGTPLIFAETVEVLRGPGSVLYGANAMNGVITINSIEPQSNKAELRSEMRVGNHGRQTYNLMGMAGAELASFVVAYQMEYDGGDRRPILDNSGRIDGDGNPQLYPSKDGYEANYLFAKVSGKGPLKGFSLQFHRQYWESEVLNGFFLFYPDSNDEYYTHDRQMLTLKYQTPPDENTKWLQRYTARLQRNALDWNARVLPNGTVIPVPDGAGGTLDLTYPAGVNESVLAVFMDVFAQAQLTYAAPFGRTTAGLEYTISFDAANSNHSANADIGLDGFPLPSTELRTLPNPFEAIWGRPLHRTSAFLEFVSERFLKSLFLFTAGLRYDRRFFNYVALEDPELPVLSKSYQQFSPRVSLAIFPTEVVSVKAMAGTSFREPSVAETLTGNTTLAAGLPSERLAMKPERAATYEVALDWHLLRGLDWRINGYYLSVADQLGYGADNIARNLYSRSNAGVETEVIARYDTGAGNFSGFVNYGYTRLLDEQVSSPLFTPQPNKLTWVPAQTAKLGLAHKIDNFRASVQAMYQGQVFRRDSDMLNPLNTALRPTNIEPWVTVDALVNYRISSWLTLGVQATNLFDSRGSLVKIQDMPFDYAIQGRRVMGTVQIDL